MAVSQFAMQGKVVANALTELVRSPLDRTTPTSTGWRLISENGDDPVRFLHELLQKMYWDAVRDEFADFILAFDD
ncbi:hypothetical protein BDW66DRAFT_149905 [Aspergillus desertorum]